MYYYTKNSNDIVITNGLEPPLKSIKETYYEAHDLVQS